METLYASTTVVLDQCWCGIWFGMPDSLHRMFREKGTTVYCPVGHTVVIRKTETQQLREQKDRLEARLVAERDQRRATERSLIAQRAATTRAKNRARAGVCPDCKRSFQNVVKHMQTKHPDLVPVQNDSSATKPAPR